MTLSTDNSTITIAIDDAADISALRVWKTDTFKDYDEAIDISSLLTGSATESINVSPTDLDESYFDGVYFIEAEDTDEVSFSIIAVLTRYKECVIERIIENGVCEDCLASTAIPMINAHTTLRALEDAIELNFIDEIITMVNALDTYCSNTCNSCGSYDNEDNDDYYTLNE